MAANGGTACTLQGRWILRPERKKQTNKQTNIEKEGGADLTRMADAFLHCTILVLPVLHLRAVLLVLGCPLSLIFLDTPLCNKVRWTRPGQQMSYMGIKGPCIIFCITTCISLPIGYGQSLPISKMRPQPHNFFLRHFSVTIVHVAPQSVLYCFFHTSAVSFCSCSANGRRELNQPLHFTIADAVDI